MQTLRLANETQTTIIDLIGGPLHLRSGTDFATPGQGGIFTYEPYGAQWDFGNFQPQTETFDLAMSGTRVMLLAEMNRLQDFIESVRLFHAGDIAAESCWLEWSAHGEEVKRSLLYSVTFKGISQDNVTPGLEECTILGTLSLTRHPLWENIEPTTLDISGIYGLSNLGGKYDYTGVPGNTLARINQTRISSGDALYRFWIGIRRFNQGVANFNPVWECEDGTNIAADTTDVAAVGVASNDSMVTTTFATAGLVERFQINVANVALAYGHTDWAHFIGRYLVLARCRVVGAGGVAGVQMHFGYTGNQIAEEIYIDNTTWRLIPLGNISISPWEGASYASADFALNYEINIYAEELVACDLDMDCLVLIPNEHLVEFEGVALAGVTDDYLDVTEDDREVAYNITIPWQASDALTFAMMDWYWPPGDGTIVVAAEGAGAHSLGDIFTAYLTYYPRWTLYRGA